MPGTNILPTGHNSTALVNLERRRVGFTMATRSRLSSVRLIGWRLAQLPNFEAAYNGGSFTATADGTPPIFLIWHRFRRIFRNISAGLAGNHQPRTGVISGIAPGQYREVCGECGDQRMAQWRDDRRTRKDFLYVPTILQ